MKNNDGPPDSTPDDRFDARLVEDQMTQMHSILEDGWLNACLHRGVFDEFTLLEKRCRL